MILTRFKLIFIEVFVFSTIHDYEMHTNCRTMHLLHLDKDSLCPLLSHHCFRHKMDDRKGGKARKSWNPGNKTHIKSSFFSQYTLAFKHLQGFRQFFAQEKSDL